ncbi:1-deoxy-D-xylulose 5-phosphate reductoisomerase [Leptospira ryugenii]|uniref:1-deoxy-D-xylulose 5-phosphate reductoisomerase n=1 Tax=Leptospira ryugenii TaxID=1917863 RepID=A0A2P2E1F8_9LEPT|nr:1-deoxy-D-xylulose-5-phosphate reductoisomerase [Leptospira ryugenii]GBF50723.1 1-deoxy-D-xylulose 5-phosphate reductoisomerase [Leptospira ryugenii]
MEGICVLGISGSVGQSTVKVLRSFPNFFSLKAFSVHSNIKLAKDLIQEFSPLLVCITDEGARQILGDAFLSTKIVYGEEGLDEIVSLSEVRTVVTAIVGSIGARPTITAIKAKKKIAIANKETLVTFGPLINALVEEHGVSMVPVDSEHNALFQLLEKEERNNIRAITLTASGGSFRDLPLDEFKHVTVQQALKHPTWSMGPKITVDSAGLVNKGLEVIEAHFLFGFSYDQIEVVIHPESIAHGLIETKDGACFLYASHPDMIFPIAHSLFYPSKTPKLLLERKPFSWKELHFREPEAKRYPALALAYQAGRAGGTAPAIFNAANEVAVALFLEERIHFTEIPQVIDESLSKVENSFPNDLAGYLEKDREVRNFVLENFKKGVMR